MARVGQGKIEEVRARADIVEIIGAHVRLRRTGRNFVGLCPFHNEKTPSFTVSAERGFFHCFGCGVGGTVFDFVMRTEGMTFPEALQTLAKRYGIAIAAAEPNGPASGERDLLLRTNQFAADFYAHVLWNTDDGVLARDYLKKRGILHETARHFLLGFAPARPANLTINLSRRGLLEPALRLGLVRQNAGDPARGREPGSDCHDMFRARLMFPIRDAQGRVIAFGGRVLDQRLPKYINSPESPVYSKARAVYGIYEARQSISRSDRAVVVEGYLDAIALWQAGFKETVATLGTALTVEQLRMLSRYTRNVVACFDGDDAGHKASLRALEVFLAAGLLGKAVFIPPGYDPDTLVRERGAEAMRSLLEAAELLVDYFVREQAQGAGQSLITRARASERVAEVLAKVTNAFEFDLLARKAATILGVSEELLRRQARRGSLRNPRAGVSASAASTAVRIDAAAQGEIGILAIALRFPQLRQELFGAVPPSSFQDGLLASIYEKTMQPADGEASETELLEGLNEHQRSRLSELMVGSLMDDISGARVLARDYADAIARRNREREVKGLTRSAVHSNEQGNEQDAVMAAQAVLQIMRQARSH
jgi:DNA primase